MYLIRTFHWVFGDSQQWGLCYLTPYKLLSEGAVSERIYYKLEKFLQRPKWE